MDAAEKNMISDKKLELVQQGYPLTKNIFSIFCVTWDNV